MNDELWWFVVRASGIVAWGLVTASVVWGLALSSRIVKRPKAGWLLDLHRYLGGSALVYTGIHLVALVADSYVEFGPSDLFIPLASPWRPEAVAWGIASLYLLVAVTLTSFVKRYLTRPMWRWVHMSSLPMFLMATIHGFRAGTDAGTPLARWVAIGSGTLVTFLLAYRVLSGRARSARASVPSSDIAGGGVPMRRAVGAGIHDA